MIGVDLVDRHRAAIESNWKRKGFLNKLFNSTEQVLIQIDSHPEQMIWLLWSMKEAAYKIYSRKLNIRIFAPAKIHCTLIDSTKKSLTGQVNIEGEIFYTSSNITKTLIYSIAAEKKHQLAYIEVHISEFCLNTDYQSLLPQSVSHHGKFLALAYLKA
jgi:phosphopantetheinyl transferase (holo-ACP synthase)